MSFKSLPQVASPTEPVIQCPRCSHQMRLTESLAGPFVERLRARFKERLDEKEAELERERDDVRREAARTERARREIEAELARRLSEERLAISEVEAERAREATRSERQARERELEDLRQTVRENDARLSQANRTHADLLRQQRELELARAEMDLTVERRIQASLDDIRLVARRESDEAARLRISERDGTIQSMARTIEELKRQAEQGSQRRQGEVQEVELEAELKARFPSDAVEPVGNGEPGADILQQVNGAAGRSAGLIMWESKRTRAWNDGWLVKLRDDQRRRRADVAIIVSQTLPRRVETFDMIGGVWVTHPRYAVPVAIALRQALLDVDGARLAQQGVRSKAEALYGYLTGLTFRQRVQALVERFDEMRSDLERERKFMTRQWAKRETQIASCVETTAGTIGDLQAIAGSTLEHLEFDPGDTPATAPEGSNDA
jgi:hypothetical protein